MLLKYTRPLTALGLGTGVLLIDLGFGAALGLWLCFTDLIYYAGLRGDRRMLRGIELSALLVTLFGVAVPLGLGWGLGEAINMGLLIGVILLLPLWWATEVRIGHPLGPFSEEREELEAERSRLRRREQELGRQEAVIAERRRMAQDLHDGVAAHVSAAALRSAAALQSAPDPQRDREALAAVRATSLSALEDLRSMVTLLRDGGAAPENWGAVQSPSQAVERARELGLTVCLEGEELDLLSDAVAGPVLHEALMNVLAHGDSAQPVTVSVTAGDARGVGGAGRSRSGSAPSHRQVTVTSSRADAEGAAPQVPFLATGTGLESMRARVTRHGGELHAQAQGESWVVRFTVPVAVPITVPIAVPVAVPVAVPAGSDDAGRPEHPSHRSSSARAGAAHDS